MSHSIETTTVTDPKTWHMQQAIIRLILGIFSVCPLIFLWLKGSAGAQELAADGGNPVFAFGFATIICLGMLLLWLVQGTAHFRKALVYRTEGVNRKNALLWRTKAAAEHAKYARLYAVYTSVCLGVCIVIIQYGDAFVAEGLPARDLPYLFPMFAVGMGYWFFAVVWHLIWNRVMLALT